MKLVMRFRSIMILLAIFISIFAVASASESFDLAEYCQEITLSEDDPNYWHDLCLAEIHNMKVFRSVPTAFESESWTAYNKTSSGILSCNPDNLNDKKKKAIRKTLDARRALIQIKPISECRWMIWDDTMPSIKDPATIEFKLSDFDEPDFRPFLLPYLQEDQTSVKGNIIVVAGGGASRRANEGEGYPIAERFYQLGYNCYVLQRRVAPYSNRDTFLDMQRSIRYLRYHAEEYGILGMDCLAAIGFSGGSATVLGTVKNLYGDIQPTFYDPNYVPDDIDALNADLDAICSMYGPNAEYEKEYTGLNTDNPNLPDMFITAGDLDGASDQLLLLAQSVRNKTRLECHIFADAEHAFRLGTEGNNTAEWVSMFDCFLTSMKR